MAHLLPARVADCAKHHRTIRVGSKDKPPPRLSCDGQLNRSVDEAGEFWAIVERRVDVGPTLRSGERKRTWIANCQRVVVANKGRKRLKEALWCTPTR